MPPITPPLLWACYLAPIPHIPLTPFSVIIGNGFTHPDTSVCASVLMGPFYINYVLVAPQIIHNLLSVLWFTIDNSCSVDFDPFGLSMKDLSTSTLLVRCDSSRSLEMLWTSSPSLLASTSSTTTWHRRPGHLEPDVMIKITNSSAISYSWDILRVCVMLVI